MNSTPNEKKEWVFQSGVPYEFTINFNDQYQINGVLSLRDVRLKSNLKKIFEKTNIKYDLLQEITMPQFGDTFKNMVPRIHYHGVVMFPKDDDIYSYLLSTAVELAQIGRYQFNPLRAKHWVTYITKHTKLFGNNCRIRNQSYKTIISRSQEKKTSNDEVRTSE